MNTGKPINKNINTEIDKFIKIPSEDITRQQNNRSIINDPSYFNGIVNEITHLELQMACYFIQMVYVSKRYSRLTSQDIEFYSKTCEQTLIIRQLKLTQVHKDTLSLGYILS